ncbi:hypothetical protein [Dactylosporangium sp. CA-092794]|uniref:hypothetical protein n=1 Tax=Dactylosporangium sp. CA-092794 TaxID=3239929 RepID=UPI003D8C1D70
MARLGVPRSGPAGYAVRLDWPGSALGTGPAALSHEFTQFTTSLPRALRHAAAARRFWSAGPLRPLSVTVVPIDRPVYLNHGRECASPDCPTTAPLLGLDPAGADPRPRPHADAAHPRRAGPS